MRPAPVWFCDFGLLSFSPPLQFPAEHINGPPLGSQHLDVRTGNQAERILWGAEELHQRLGPFIRHNARPLFPQDVAPVPGKSV